MTHSSHDMNWETQRCTRCDRWSHTVEARLECRGVEEEERPAIDWTALIRSGVAS